MQYDLKIGRIISSRLSGETTENTFRVRVLPDMESISETELLPTYPNFFSTTQIGYNPDDTVWVLCSDDFQVGFILGLTQPPVGSALSPVVSLINELEKSIGLSESAYDDISIVSVYATYLQYHCTSSGRNGCIYNTAALYIVDSDGTTYHKNPGTLLKATASGEIVIQGTSISEYVKDKTVEAITITEQAQSKKVDIGGTVKESVGGSFQHIVAGNSTENVIGDKTELIAKKRKETIGLGVDTKIVAGGSSETVLLGDYKITVVAGKAQIMSGAGVDIISTGPVKITSPMIEFVTPIFKVPPVPATPTGLGPLCGIPFCLFTGAPQAASTMGGI